MFKVGNKYIITPEIEVILQLQSELHLKGIQRLYKVKQTYSGIQVCCPIHNEGQEKRPSCGINTLDRKNVKHGTVHCFTCGYVANIDEFVSNCFGRMDKGKFGRQWLLENFVVGVQSTRDCIRKISREEENLSNKYITEEELDTYRYYHDYMFERKLTEDIIEKFDVGYDKKTDCLTFPVMDENNNCLFIARRSVKTKYFNYPESVQKPLYGIQFTKGLSEVIICESIINALTCWVYGKPAVALIGLGSPMQLEKLKSLRLRKYILALDADDAGFRSTEKIKKYLKGSGLVTELDIPDSKDINDLSEKEFLNLHEIY